MSKTEVKTTISLALMMSMRMLGLFMVLPVFAIYGVQLEGANALLIGLAIGAYGFTQAFLQIPFGRLSDSWGRKPVITLGLSLFALGSIIAGVSDSIYGVIVGRALQGAGAVASTIMALVGDLVRDEHRTKSMAMVGILGPALTHYFELSGLFLLTALLAGFGVMINLKLPTPIVRIRNRESLASKETLSGVLKQLDLRILNMGIFVLHMAMTALFLVVPVVLVRSLDLAVQSHWMVYLPIMFGSFVLMVPFMIMAEVKRQVRRVFRGAIALLACSLFVMAFFMNHPVMLLAGLGFYFLAFNLLEALLPSLVSRFAPAVSKGSAMGVYSPAQFAGALPGRALGGWLLGEMDAQVLLGVMASAVLLWWLASWKMSEPRYAQTKMLFLGKMAPAEGVKVAEELLSVPGIEEATVIAEEGTAYLKVDKKVLAPEALRKFSVMAG